MRGNDRGEFAKLQLVAGEDEEIPAPLLSPRPQGRKLVIFASAVAGVALVSVAANRAGLLKAAVLASSSLDAVVQETLTERCGHVEEHVDFVYDVLAGVGHVDNVASYQECCAICKAESECAAYTWVADAKLVNGNPGQCWLKGGLFVSKATKKGVFSAFAKADPLHKVNKVLPPLTKTTASTTKKPVSNLRAGDAEADAMENLAAEAAEKAEEAHVVLKDKDAEKADDSEADEGGDLTDDQSDDIERAEQRWAEATLKKKAEELAEKLANERAEKELQKKANALATLRAKQLADNLAKEEEESRKQPQMSKQDSQSTFNDAPERFKNCAASGEGCLKSKCCKSPGHQCFTKNAWWAQCMPECNKGPNPVDQVSPMPWECTPLGERTPGTPVRCAVDGENCKSSKCCMKGGTTCFAKNASWARCKESCNPGPDLMADDNQPWTCEKFGSRTVGAAPWVATKCAGNGQDCSHAACCKESNHQCFRQDQFYAECKPTCMPGEKLHAWDKAWSCEKVGSRTPAIADDAADSKGKVGEWVEKQCVGDGDSCLEAQCCKGVDHQCYTKNEFWAACKQDCSTAPDPKDKNATWTCKDLGPRGWGLATKGFPSLYCITLYMPTSYEAGLLKYHLDVNGGIFACDGYNVYAAEPNTLGTSKDGILVEAILIPKIKVGKSQDGTAGNAKLFMAVWDKVIASGRFKNYDWTIKVDADAVMLPWRVRDHMRPHSGEKVYVVNCNKYPDSPNFPMMYGSMEIFSGPAMLAYAKSSWKCGKDLPWAAWGEDYYMTKCMDYVGVNRIADFGVIGDNVCTGANCGDTYTGAFHPFKSVEKWRACWEEATSTGL